MISQIILSILAMTNPNNQVKKAAAYLWAAADMLNHADIEMLAVNGKADDPELRELLKAWFEVRNQMTSCSFSYNTAIERER